jgi:glycerate kinase
VFNSLGGEFVYENVLDPLLRPISARWLWLCEQKKAYIEMAQSSGLSLLRKEDRKPLETSSYGLGEIILNAIERGCEEIMICVGGSATNDGGAGFLSAMGVVFSDINGNKIEPKGINLGLIKNIDVKKLKCKNVRFKVLVDVDSVFTGIKGATKVFGSQKGADKKDIAILETAMCSLASLYKVHCGYDLNKIKGSGAAGGVPGACFAILKAEIESGADHMIRLSDLKEKIKRADWLITGEGKLDKQTLSGKIVKKLVDVSLKNNKRILIIAGNVENQQEINRELCAEIINLRTDNASFDIKNETKRAIENNIKLFFENNSQK